jgi:hypothetical protein
MEQFRKFTWHSLNPYSLSKANHRTLFFDLWNIQFYPPWKPYAAGALQEYGPNATRNDSIWEIHGRFEKLLVRFRTLAWAIWFPVHYSFLSESRAPSIRPSVPQVWQPTVLQQVGDQQWKCRIFCGLARLKATSNMGSHIFIYICHTPKPYWCWDSSMYVYINSVKLLVVGPVKSQDMIQRKC